MTLILVRVVPGLAYLGATAAWALLMLLVSALRCDDSCSAQSSRWSDDPDAWRYDVIPWLGLAALFLALAAIALSFVRRRLGLAALAAHIAVFVANLLILDGGRLVTTEGFVLPAILAAAAGFVAVGGRGAGARPAT